MVLKKSTENSQMNAEMKTSSKVDVSQKKAGKGRPKAGATEGQKGVAGRR
jgi:hypothetical protein